MISRPHLLLSVVQFARTLTFFLTEILFRLVTFYNLTFTLSFVSTLQVLYYTFRSCFLCYLILGLLSIDFILLYQFSIIIFVFSFAITCNLSYLVLSSALMNQLLVYIVIVVLVVIVTNIHQI